LGGDVFMELAQHTRRIVGRQTRWVSHQLAATSHGKRELRYAQATDQAMFRRSQQSISRTAMALGQVRDGCKT
jgi:hypothetical protein